MSYLKPMMIPGYGNKHSKWKGKVFAEGCYPYKALLSKERFYKHILHMLEKPEPTNIGIC